MADDATRRMVIVTVAILVVSGVVAALGAGSAAIKMAILAIAHLAGLVLIKMAATRLRARRRADVDA